MLKNDFKITIIFEFTVIRNKSLYWFYLSYSIGPNNGFILLRRIFYVPKDVHNYVLMCTSPSHNNIIAHHHYTASWYLEYYSLFVVI